MLSNVNPFKYFKDRQIILVCQKQHSRLSIKRGITTYSFCKPTKLYSLYLPPAQISIPNNKTPYMFVTKPNTENTNTRNVKHTHKNNKKQQENKINNKQKQCVQAV